MTHKHIEFEELANELIGDEGTDAQIIGPDVQTGGPAWEPTLETPEPVDCKIFLTSWDETEIDGTVIKSGDRAVLLALDGLRGSTDTADIINWLTYFEWAETDGPNLGGKMVIGGETFHIVSPVTPIAPAGVAVVFKINLRK